MEGLKILMFFYCIKNLSKSRKKNHGKFFGDYVFTLYSEKFIWSLKSMKIFSLKVGKIYLKVGKVGKIFPTFQTFPTFKLSLKKYIKVFKNRYIIKNYFLKKVKVNINWVLRKNHRFFLNLYKIIDFLKNHRFY